MEDGMEDLRYGMELYGRFTSHSILCPGQGSMLYVRGAHLGV